MSPSLPPLIARLYGAVAVLQLEGVLLPPACTGTADSRGVVWREAASPSSTRAGAPPFESERTTMGAALGLWGVAVAIYYASRHPTVRLGGQFALMWAMILYPSTALTAAGLLACTPVALSPQVRSRVGGEDG